MRVGPTGISAFLHNIRLLLLGVMVIPRMGVLGVIITPALLLLAVLALDVHLYIGPELLHLLPLRLWWG
jgi:hypothetical protein